MKSDKDNQELADQAHSEYVKEKEETMKDDGGQAFPSEEIQYVGGEGYVRTQVEGMTLRDYFAIHATKPSLGDIKCLREDDYGRVNRTDEDREAYFRYKQADAMLKEREEV